MTATRTTITIDEDVLIEAKTEAARTGHTLGQVFADAFRQMVSRRDASRRSAPVDLPTWPIDGEGGLMPGVNIESNAELRAYFDDLGEKSWP
jgi:hypothetical protein